MAATDLAPTIATTATGPAAAAVDGLSVTQQSIAAQVQGDRYLAAKAARAARNRGMMFSKFIPAGAMPDSQTTGFGGLGGFASPGGF